MRGKFIFVALLAACNGDDSDTDGGAICDAAVTGFTPADEAGPTARNIPIVVTFSGISDDTATITATAGGAPVEGTVTVADGALTFTPTAPFPANGEVSWTASLCDESAAGTFTTGEIDEAVDPATADGMTFAVDLSGATWISPPGGGALFEQFFAGAFLIGIEAISVEELDAIGAAGEETESGNWQQDPCYETIDFEPVDFSTNPYFTIAADEMSFTVQGFQATIHGVTVSGAIDGDNLVDGTFSGEGDLRDYNGQITCPMLEQFAGISCVDCLSDGETQCVWMEAEEVVGSEVPGLSLVPNTSPEECNEDTQPTE